jgi:hypothetical protein
VFAPCNTLKFLGVTYEVKYDDELKKNEAILLLQYSLLQEKFRAKNRRLN